MAALGIGGVVTLLPTFALTMDALTLRSGKRDATRGFLKAIRVAGVAERHMHQAFNKLFRVQRLARPSFMRAVAASYLFFYLFALLDENVYPFILPTFPEAGASYAARGYLSPLLVFIAIFFVNGIPDFFSLWLTSYCISEISKGNSFKIFITIDIVGSHIIFFFFTAAIGTLSPDNSISSLYEVWERFSPLAYFTHETPRLVAYQTSIVTSVWLWGFGASLYIARSNTVVAKVLSYIARKFRLRSHPYKVISIVSVGLIGIAVLLFRALIFLWDARSAISA